LLSYIALVVGAFLIYNTISVSVVRRRTEIGIVRAVGASRTDVLCAFLGEAACLGIAGASSDMPLGRIMASGAVKLMALTVESLYVSSRPGSIALTPLSVFWALLIGVGVSVISALSPAREAMNVSPADAMAQGRREYIAGTHMRRDLLIASLLEVLGVIAAQAPAIGGKPLLGYLATILIIAASAYAMPSGELSVVGYLRPTEPTGWHRSSVGRPQFDRCAAQDFRARGCFSHGCGHDGLGRNHGWKFSPDRRELDEYSIGR